jgi:hypothetical protein
MMPAPVAWREHAHALLTAVQSAGVPATMDPRKVNALGVLLLPPDWRQTTGGGVMAAWTAYLVGPGTSDTDAVFALLDVLDAVRLALPGCVEAEWSQVALEPDAPSRPAYRLTIAADPL